MSSNCDFSVIIPVFNASETIEDIVTRFAAIKPYKTQIILVDDCSQDSSREVLLKISKEFAGVEVLLHDQNKGAGVARNTGFDVAHGRYCMFFDADDEIHTDVVCKAISGLDQSGADLAMMPYFYRRNLETKQNSMNNNDENVWRKIMADADQKIVKLTDAPTLLGFSNYPWNKVIRTSKYRHVGLQFGSTSVNNDILGHWYSLLFADDILLMDEEVCTHIVVPTGSNLTNQSSLKRLELFDALDETYDVLVEQPALRSRYSHHYWSLVDRTARWA